MFSSRSRIIISLGLGLLTAGIFWGLLEKNKREVRSQNTMGTVLRAKQYLKTGRVISKNSVEEVLVPEAFIQPTALQKKEQLLDERGKGRLKPRVEILKGEQILRSKLFDDKVFMGLSWTLDPGQTAITIRLDSEQAVGGWIRPGDWIHLFCTFDRQPGWPNPRSQLLLDRVQVLAINDQIRDLSAPLEDKKMMNTMASDSVLVTIAVTPKEAGVVALAGKKGRFMLALVSPLDIRPTPRVSVRPHDLK